MDRYPILEISIKKLKNNAKILKSLCNKSGIEPCAVIKGFCAQTDMVQEIVGAGYKSVGSSRVEQLRQIKQAKFDGKTLLVRIPMKCELEDVVKYCDTSLESEKQTLIWLNEEAKKQGVIHNVILMRDLGDLREGIFDPIELVALAYFTEKDLDNIHLYGIGANLICYGSVAPTVKNLTELVQNAKMVEEKIGRKLEIVSGGSTSSVPLVARGEMPKGINHLRIGEAIVVPYDLDFSWNTHIDGMSNDVLTLKTQIVEINDKPTKPIGESGINCFGSYREYADNGIRKRAIVALGEYDMGNYEKLLPKDIAIKVLGASSDHTILDIEDSKTQYELGDIIEFNLRYQSMLFSTSNTMVYKKKI